MALFIHTHMRLREENGISIMEEVVRVDNKGHAPYIDFDSEEADIIVLSYQPGVGKTYCAMQYIETHPNSFYFTERHETIN